MDKEEYIKKYGEEAYAKTLQQARDRYAEHREERKASAKGWSTSNPERVKANRNEWSCKGGKYYERQQEYDRTGLRCKRKRIRMKHGRFYRPYKQIIAPNSQLHHEWIPNTSEYTGMALVEKDQHMHGFVDVIQILEGKITLLTEEEIRMGVVKNER